MDWINVFGLIVVVLMLLPNMIYAYQNPRMTNKCTNELVNAVEQIGRYGSMFFMAFRIGLLEFGFWWEKVFSVWVISVSILLAGYWLFWCFYLKKQNLHFAMVLAVIPSVIFIFSGLIQRNLLLLLFGTAFSIGHNYVTYHNNRLE